MTTLHGHSPSLRRINTEQQTISDRYYLHHHGPNHNNKRTLHTIRQHMSSSSLYHLKHSHVSERDTRSVIGDKTKQKKRKCSMSTSQLNAIEAPAKRPTSEPARTIRGHPLVAASCSRLRTPCETCQHTVHKSRYLYCKNCPVVCHMRESCLNEIPRDCPARELGLEGWGESQHPIKFMEPSTLDLEAVFLSGMLGLQANKCYECGRVLDPSVGREFLSDNGLNKRDSAGPVQDTGGDGSITNSKSLSLLPVKFSRSNSAKESTHRRASSNHLLQDTPTKMRICYMTGKYYCDRCHWNDQWYVPGSIFLLNDASMHPLSRSAYLKLRVLWDTAIYRIPSYWHQENRQAAEAFEIRTQLHHLLRYTLVCSVASALKECAELSEPSHLLGYPNYLRLCDVMEILNGQLIEKLRHHVNLWTHHVQSCEQCISIQHDVDHDDRLSMKDQVT